MDYEITVPLPPLPLGPGCTVKLEAITPTTGGVVTGVVAVNPVITAIDAAGGADQPITGAFLYVPGPDGSEGLGV